MRKILVILSVLFPLISSAAAKTEFSGNICDASSKEPIPGAVVKIDDGVLWAMSDLDGKYSIMLSDGNYSMTVECLGYVKETILISVRGNAVRKSLGEGSPFVQIDPSSLDFSLNEESLALDEVYVTAQRSASSLGTSHMMGKEALEHLQMSNMSDMTALLPGGKTVNPDLTKDTGFSLRDGGSTAGNAAFGTALEVDGVRLGGNAGVSEPAGASTRSVAVENIESVEVVTGIPSAEYGDLNSGMVKINTKKGRTPLNLVFSVNPRTYQTSLSKGIDLGKENGVLNVSGEWARATSKLISPYTSYTRRNVSATYSNTFNKVLRFEAGLAGNIGGMNSKDDPDANVGNFEKARDNVFRANTKLMWVINNPWVTSLKLESALVFNDNLSQVHSYNSSATMLPAIHSEKEGYSWAELLPLTYYSDKIVDSKELNFNVNATYDWVRSFGAFKNRVKAGVQFKTNGNVGRGEYYQDPSLAPNGYRPRPYTDYPFMHNLSEFIEDQVTIPFVGTTIYVNAGLRFEQVFVKGTRYNGINSLSPRFNLKWKLNNHVTLRGGWGISEKLPSFWVLYPKPEYRDILTGTETTGSVSRYEYYTIPYTMEYNSELKWQRNSNSELGLDLKWGDWSLSAVGYCNITNNPYQYSYNYTPFSYENHQTSVTDRTFVKTVMQTNGKPVTRAGAELTIDFPEIKPIRTSFRADASYSYTSYVDDMLSSYYPSGISHPTEKNRSYPYYGIYARGNSSSVVNGKLTHSMDANITSITHIPQARLVITCRLEMALLRRSRNLSSYNGEEYAFNVSGTSTRPSGGSIYEGNSYAAIYPLYYCDTDGVRHPFTEAQALDPAFAELIIPTGNAYTFAQDGYGFYCSANLSVTKEIGKHVSLSFFANNFTASRQAVASMATGVSAIFVPQFYYGLTCRIKL